MEENSENNQNENQNNENPSKQDARYNNSENHNEDNSALDGEGQAEHEENNPNSDYRQNTFCPNCGKEIKYGQKFCTYCGTKIDLPEKELIKFNFKNFIKKNLFQIILASIVGLTVIIIGSMYAIKYNQNIKPFNITLNWEDLGDVDLSAKYNSRDKLAEIELTAKDNVVEDWQVEKLGESDETYEFSMESDNGIDVPEITYDTIVAEEGKPLILKFYIENETVSDFVNLKKLIEYNGDKGSFSLSYPDFFYANKTLRNKEKAKYLAKKEAERKRKEWEEKALSNCVYKTTDGVCFTTKFFKPEYIKEPEPNSSAIRYNFWLGAKETCSGKGYKLPNDSELRSLFSDILGVVVNSGVRNETFKGSNTNIPTNYDIIKQLIPNGNERVTNTNITLWENEDYTNTQAYIRSFGRGWGGDTTSQAILDKYSYYNYSHIQAICVFDHNGSPHKSLLQKQQENDKIRLQQQKIKEEKLQQEAKDGLF